MYIVIYYNIYISFSGEPWLIQYINLNLHHHHKINFYSPEPLAPILHPTYEITSDTFASNHFYGLRIWTWNCILYSLLWPFVGGAVCFLPKSTWIILTLLCVLPQDFGWFYFWGSTSVTLFGSPPLSYWSLFLHKLRSLRVYILLCGS